MNFIKASDYTNTDAKDYVYINELYRLKGITVDTKKLDENHLELYKTDAIIDPVEVYKSFFNVGKLILTKIMSENDSSNDFSNYFTDKTKFPAYINDNYQKLFSIFFKYQQDHGLPFTKNYINSNADNSVNKMVTLFSEYSLKLFILYQSHITNEDNFVYEYNPNEDPVSIIDFIKEDLTATYTENNSDRIIDNINIKDHLKYLNDLKRVQSSNNIERIEMFEELNITNPNEIVEFYNKEDSILDRMVLVHCYNLINEFNQKDIMMNNKKIILNKSSNKYLICEHSSSLVLTAYNVLLNKLLDIRKIKIKNYCECEICGKPFPKNRNQKCCSKECRKQQRKNSQAKYDNSALGKARTEKQRISRLKTNKK